MPTTIDQYTADDGAILKYRIWSGNNHADALVYLHGIESHSEWFSECAEKICSRGISVYGLDRRGSGLNADNRGDCRDYLRPIFDVINFATSPAAKPLERLHLCGLSWGGKLAAAVSIVLPDIFSSMTLISPGIFPRVAPPASEKIRIAFDALFRPQSLHPIPIQDEMFTSVPKHLKYIANDPLRLHRVTARFYRESIRMDRFLRGRRYQWSVPTQLLLAEHDAIVDNQKLRQMFDCLRLKQKRILTYKGCNHSLQFEKPDAVARDIIEWQKLNRVRSKAYSK
jgi:alpha-beta hydrolase superfamily lysophospholipase